MPNLKHKTPCNACPFRRESAAGWLGSATPEEFIATTKAEHDMPCHKAVDYSRKNWQKQAAAGPRCAGSLIFLRNTFQLPVEPELRAARNAVVADPKTVFSNSAEFLQHHTREYKNADS